MEAAQLREDGCLISTVGYGANGYLRVRIQEKFVLVHRLAYEIEFGVTLDQAMTVDHMCHNIAADNGLCDGGPTCRHRACIRPQHLALASAVDNWRRGTEGTPRIRRSKTHCPQGHPYDEANTYVRPSTGHRSCRTCHRIREAAKKGHPTPS